MNRDSTSYKNELLSTFLQPYKMTKKMHSMLIIILFTSFIFISLDIPHFYCSYCAKLLVSMTFENSVRNGRG